MKFEMMFWRKRREEKEFKQVIERLSGYVSQNRQSELIKELENIIDTVQQEAFMEGYEYAIELLQESILKI